VQSVVELTLGLLVDLFPRAVSRAAAGRLFTAGPDARDQGSAASSAAARWASIGYGRISRRALAPLLAALGVTVLVSDPYAQLDDQRFIKFAARGSSGPRPD